MSHKKHDKYINAALELAAKLAHNATGIDYVVFKSIFRNIPKSLECGYETKHGDICDIMLCNQHRPKIIERNFPIELIENDPDICTAIKESEMEYNVNITKKKFGYN